MSCSTISPALRSALKPMVPVAQNVHPWWCVRGRVGARASVGVTSGAEKRWREPMYTHLGAADLTGYTDGVAHAFARLMLVPDHDSLHQVPVLELDKELEAAGLRICPLDNLGRRQRKFLHESGPQVFRQIRG